MRRAIREHLRDFVAIGVLVVLALVTTGVILAQQQPTSRPGSRSSGHDHFELKAEFTTAQAVTPGQGQTDDHRRHQGRRRVQGVNLESGRAVVTMDIDNKYAPLIHPDATLLLRPRTGPAGHDDRDRPGHQTGQQVKEGSTIPLARPQPNVQPDQILASLDGDTRAFLQLLLQAAGQGLAATTAASSRPACSASSPTARDLAKHQRRAREAAPEHRRRDHELRPA